MESSFHPQTSNSKTSATKDYDPSRGITWGERNQDFLEKVWSKVPSSLASYAVSAIIFILGCTISGDWVIFFAHWFHKKSPIPNGNVSAPADLENMPLVDRFHMQNVLTIAIFANLVGYVTYFGIGGFLQWYFYFRRRETPHEWKCQPTRWLTPELEWHEIKWGSITLLVNSNISAMLAAWIVNGGWSMVYYDLDEYGWLWFFLQWPVVFLAQDYIIYWAHRIFHGRFLYVNFHKLHHTYKAPTAFSVTSIHPVEALVFQGLYAMPMFVVPVHWAVYCTIVGYIYYHGIIDHSGINFKSMWPWQPDVTFHDNHHQYFHVNYGFNFWLWDTLHGTHRRKDRIYREDIWTKKGITLEEASKELLDEEMEEREIENRDDKQELTDFLKTKIVKGE